MSPGQVWELFIRRSAVVGNTAGRSVYGEHGRKGKALTGTEFVLFRNPQEGLFYPKQILEERSPLKGKGFFFLTKGREN